MEDFSKEQKYLNRFYAEVVDKVARQPRVSWKVQPSRKSKLLKLFLRMVFCRYRKPWQ